MVTTREPGGWLEAGTMGVGRQQFMAQFAEPSLAERIQFVAPLARCSDADPETESIAPDGTLSIHVHAKVLIVDDALPAHRLVELEQPLDGLRHGVRPRHRGGERGAAALHRVGPQSLDRRALGQRREERRRSARVGRAHSPRSGSLPRVPVFSTAHGARHPRLTPWRRAARAPAFRSVEPIERDESAGIDLVVQLGDPERVVSAEELVAQATGIRDPRPL